jgi:hypothetical protein
MDIAACYALGPAASLAAAAAAAAGPTAQSRGLMRPLIVDVDVAVIIVRSGVLLLLLPPPSQT